MKNPGQRAEYLGRINKVLDYIEAHIGEELTLSTLAELVFFSPFHFHRIFKAMVGETLNQYIHRIRIEKSAFMLVYHPHKTITDIALDCGFCTSASFARAFKDMFAMTASEWRVGGYQSYRKIGKTDRKNDQMDGKNRKTWTPDSPYLVHLFDNLKWKVMIEDKIKTQVEVKNLPEMTVAYVRHVGAYQGDSELFGRLFTKLMTWAGPRGLIQFPQTQMLSVYYDNPDITDDEKLRVDVAISVPEDTEVDGEIGKMKLKGGTYAVARFEILPHEYGDAWDAVYGGWLPESGYQPIDSPCMELYQNDPNTHPEGKHIVDICIPVKPS